MTNENRNESQDRVVELLEELVKWTRVTSIPDVKKLLVETLQHDTDKLAYHSSDGKRTSREVGAIATLGKNAITRRWKSWIRLGIVEPISVGVGIRAKSLFSLADFGIDLLVSERDSQINNETQVEENSDA